MRVVQINATCGNGSTGKICVAISKLLTLNGLENYIFYTQGHNNYDRGIQYSNEKYKKIQALKSRIFGNGGFNSNFATYRLIKLLKEIKPDIVHIHNIHAHDCNVETLFQYLKDTHIKVFWTFHDCWAFTANCPHFTLENCTQWQNECKECPKIKETSWLFDRSNYLFNKKKKCLNGLDLHIITPSEWLAALVKQSFLKEYPVSVINNGIDLSVFRPTENSFRKDHGIEKGYIVLGVAFGWGYRKGLDVFIELAKRLDKKFHIVLVGTNNQVDKILPKQIISIHRTQNQKELAVIYSAADVFINPTREENYPTVNMESLSCGTPIITFDTGGSKEIIDKSCGVYVPCNDVDAMYSEICRICENNSILRKYCLERAKRFDQDKSYQHYIDLYMSRKDMGEK